MGGKCMKKILVVGSMNTDQSILVDEIPKVGESVLGSHMVFSQGGKGGNQAFACGKLGAHVQMLGCLGKDDFGNNQAENLAVVNVDVSEMMYSDHDHTGTEVIYINREGNNCIVIAPGANQECDVSYLIEHDAVIRESDYVLTQMEIPVEAVLYLMKKAREYGKVSVLNPAPAPENMPEEIYSFCTYITPNETELEKLTGMPCGSFSEIRAASEKLLEKGVENVLVTIGENGAILTNKEGSIHYATIHQEAVDTTAAGDTFNAAFLTALSEGKKTEEAIRFANAAASLTVRKRGAQSAIPTREETEEALLDYQLIPERIS